MQALPKILLVDDNPDNLKALEVVLRGLNAELIKVTNGNDALKATLHHKFALALLDVQMPEMDGYELANILKTEERTEHLPFIFISAVYTDHHNMTKGYNKGAYNFFAKPFDSQSLVRSVVLFLDKYNEAGQQAELNRKLDERTKEIEKKNAELEKMNNELQSFAYIASHDLQEPLRKIASFTNVIIHNEKSLSEQTKDYMNRIKGAVTRGQLLIADLLTYSQAVDIGNAYQETDLNDLLKSVEEDYCELLEEKKGEIITTNLPKVNVIPFHFRQVFHNLISNSIKYSSPERKLKINISAETIAGEKAESLKLPTQDVYTHIAVADNGIGFEAQYKEKIFRLFQRLHGRSEYSGAGIGLAIVKKIIDNHKGVIEASSVMGQGTTFHIYLPA